MPWQPGGVHRMCLVFTESGDLEEEGDEGQSCGYAVPIRSSPNEPLGSLGSRDSVGEVLGQPVFILGTSYGPLSFTRSQP